MKIVVVNYTPINCYTNRYFGARSHLRALIRGFRYNNYFTIQFGGLGKPYIKYDKENAALFINIFPYTIPQKNFVRQGSEDVNPLKAILIAFFKTLVSKVFSLLISVLSLFKDVYYYERATKSVTFRPRFVKRRFLEINDSYMPNDFQWFNVIACVKSPIQQNTGLKYFENPWPCEFSDIYKNSISKNTETRKKFNLVLINTSPHGISEQNITAFISSIVKQNLDIEIFYLGEYTENLFNALSSFHYKINYLPIMDQITYQSLLSRMDIAFVTYGDALNEAQKKIATPMKIMDLLAYKIKVFCDQSFSIFDDYPGIVTVFNETIRPIVNEYEEIHMDNFFEDVDPAKYVKKMFQI